MDSSIGNLILTNLAFWVFVLYPVVPKLLLVLFLSWLKLRSELSNNYIKGSKYGWIGFSMSNSVILWLISSQKWTRLIWISNWTHLFCYLLFTIYLFIWQWLYSQPDSSGLKQSWIWVWQQAELSWVKPKRV